MLLLTRQLMRPLMHPPLIRTAVVRDISKNSVKNRWSRDACGPMLDHPMARGANVDPSLNLDGRRHPLHSSPLSYQIVGSPRSLARVAVR